jgi:hypothetical protein
VVLCVVPHRDTTPPIIICLKATDRLHDHARHVLSLTGRERRARRGVGQLVQEPADRDQHRGLAILAQQHLWLLAFNAHKLAAVLEIHRVIIAQPGNIEVP